MKENKTEQLVKLYLDDKLEPELIDSTDAIIDTDNSCENTIKFCCTSTVPDGFILDLNLCNLSVCFDFSELSCCLETQSTMCEIPNPCDGTLTCPVDIQAVRLVGCARMLASAGNVKPILGISKCKCSICCNTTTCVSQIIGFTCDEKPPCEPCFKSHSGRIKFFVTKDDCGRQVLTVEAEIKVKFIGCD